jgi:(S)-ureidoglycine aminohydrolase
MATIILILFTWTSFLQDNHVVSRAYQWDDLKPVKEETRVRRQILTGETSSLSKLEVHASTLEPGKAPHNSHTHNDAEELIIVKEGQLEVTIKNQSQVLNTGSIAYVIPGEEHGFINKGSTPCTYYILKFKSKAPTDIQRAQKAGGSFMIDWQNFNTIANDKGTRTNIYDKPTALFKRFEIHVTTLNQGLTNHKLHQHSSEEILIIRTGYAEQK